jgi:lipoprotein signal peptidase
MSSNISENERRVLYLSLFIIVLLAIILQFTSDQTYSLLALLFLGVIAIGNIVYIYTRSKK